MSRRKDSVPPNCLIGSSADLPLTPANRLSPHPNNSRPFVLYIATILGYNTSLAARTLSPCRVGGQIPSSRLFDNRIPHRHPACPQNPPGLSRPARPPRHPQSRLLLPFVPPCLNALVPAKKIPFFGQNPPAGDEYPMDGGPAAPPPLVRGRCSLTIAYCLIRDAATASASVIRHSALAILHISGSFQGQNRVI